MREPEPASNKPQITCPGCRRVTVYSRANIWRPFCGERCRRADLGAWASEAYRVALPPSDEDPDDPAKG